MVDTTHAHMNTMQIAFLLRKNRFIDFHTFDEAIGGILHNVDTERDSERYSTRR